MAQIFHYLTQAVCYLPLLIALIFLVLYVPALALFPRLVQTPFLFSFIPLVSTSILSGLGFLLFQLGGYQHNVVLIITLGLAVVAVVRQLTLVAQEKNFFYRKTFSKEEKILFAISFSIVLPMIPMSGLSAFMIDDALVSWNHWALMLIHQSNPSSISEGYPLVFPYFLSYIYQLLGTSQYQGVVKALLVFIPFSLINLFLFPIKKSSHMTQQKFWIFFVIVWVSIFPGFLDVDFYRFYSVGYADPLLAVMITASVSMLLAYCESDHSNYLFLSLIIGIAASLTKQPGFLWSLLGFPIILFAKMLKSSKFNWVEMFSVVVMIIPTLVWVLGSGKHFEHNTGVLTASLGTLNISALVLLKALMRSVLKYWIFQPSLLILTFFAIYFSKNIYEKILIVFFILPGILLWFIFGSYNIREGLYLLTSCGLLITRNFYVVTKLSNDSKPLSMTKNFFLILSGLLFIFFSIREQTVQHNGVRDHLYPLNASKTLIYHYFSEGAPKIYQEIYGDPHKKIWSENYFVNSIFYGNNNLIRPDLKEVTLNGLYQNILETRPDILFTTGTQRYETPSSRLLLDLNRRCPFLFKEISLGHPLYGVRAFELENKNKTLCDIT